VNEEALAHWGAVAPKTNKFLCHNPANASRHNRLLEIKVGAWSGPLLKEVSYITTFAKIIEVGSERKQKCCCMGVLFCNHLDIVFIFKTFIAYVLGLYGSSPAFPQHD
jgi:hypothetical protein